MLIKIVNIIISLLYLSFVILVAKSDKEKGKIDKRILVYGVIVTVFSVVVQYFFTGEKLNRIIIYLILIVVLEVLSIQVTKKKRKYDYQLNLLVILVLYTMFFNELVTIITVGFTLIICGIYLEIHKMFKKRKKAKVSVAFFMSIANLISLITVYLNSLIYNL